MDHSRALSLPAPDHSPDGPISEWDDVGNDILDKLSAGQLQIWGREIVRGAALSFRNLTPIDSSYWRAARFTYAFLLDGHERDLHVSQTESTRLPDLGDLRVNREDALALWPHPLRARWTVESIVLSARYFNAPTQEVSIPCTSLTLFDAQIVIWAVAFVVDLLGARTSSRAGVGAAASVFH